MLFLVDIPVIFALIMKFVKGLGQKSNTLTSVVYILGFEKPVNFVLGILKFLSVMNVKLSLVKTMISLM